MCCKESSFVLPNLKKNLFFYSTGPFHNEIQVVLMPLLISTNVIDQHILDQYHNEIELKET